MSKSILSASFAVPDQWRGPLPRSEFDRDIWAGVCMSCGLVHAPGDGSPNAVRCERLMAEPMTMRRYIRCTFCNLAVEGIGIHRCSGMQADPINDDIRKPRTVTAKQIRTCE